MRKRVPPMALFGSKLDEIVKSPQIRFPVIPVETGIQSFQ